MTRYLLSVHTTADARPEAMTSEEVQQGYARVAALEEDMRTAGALLFSGRLTAPSAARVVRASGRKIRMTDGPFLESKEAIGGFYIVEAADDEAALDWASKTSAAISMPIEVRPFWQDAAAERAPGS
ncbi:MAG: YciI family protein [Candidatus Limnocylindria bacterium]